MIWYVLGALVLYELILSRSAVRGFLRRFALGSLFLLASEFVGFAIVAVIVDLVEPGGVVTVLDFGVVLLGSEFMWYWFHRWSHVGGWYWHRWHHVPRRVTVLTSWVQHPIFVVLALVRFVPFLVMGYSINVVVVVGLVQSVVTMVAHTEGLKLPRALAVLVVTPRYHRWHHAVRARCNFGLSLTVFDYLFGTFRFPDKEPRLGSNSAPDYIEKILEKVW